MVGVRQNFKRPNPFRSGIAIDSTTWFFIMKCNCERTSSVEVQLVCSVRQLALVRDTDIYLRVSSSADIAASTRALMVLMQQARNKQRLK